MPDDCDIFEGDNTNINSEHALSLDLFSISNKYKKYWKFPDRSDFHQAIYITISKGLNNDQTNQIMQKITNSIGKEITPEKFSFTDKKMKEWGLSNEKIQIIKKIKELQEITSSNLCKIKEGGIYLVKAFKILQEEDDDTFLMDDYNIRKNMSILFVKNKLMTTQEARDISKVWQGHRSQISYFLYRLKESGAIKILDEEELDEKDFLN